MANSNKSNKKKNLYEFIDQISKLGREELKDFLEAILTPSELEEIPTRLQIIKQLKQGIPQHQIAENLGVGVATVTRGSKELKKGRFKSVDIDADTSADANDQSESSSWQD